MKFTPEGGQITVAFDTATLRNGRNEVIITVSDTGNGIPEDKLEKIFERYYQITDPVKGAYNMGTGIGLYYARRLATLHHGAITASNNADRGATFTLTLPTDDEAYSTEEKYAGREEQMPSSRCKHANSWAL